MSGYLIKLAHDPLGRHVEVNRDRQGFAIEVINHIEGAKARALPDRIAHEVCRPTFIHRLTDLQRRRVPRRQAPLALAPFVQFQRNIQAINSLVIPTMTQPPQSLEQFPEPLFWSAMGQFQKQPDDLTITIRSRAIPINRSPQVHRSACLPLTHVELFAQTGNQLPLNHRPYSFFVSTSFNIRWSRDNSAYICFSFRFSSSSSRSRLISDASIPPYFFFHL